MKKAETILLKGNQYARVATRIKEFRQDCPQGLIVTTPEFKEGDVCVFTARVLKDKGNPASAEATGHSIGKLTGDKTLEKLESVAIGRALAVLGYLASGEIASADEMEEFLIYQNEKKAKSLIDAAETIAKIKTMASLKAYYEKNKGTGKEHDALIINRKKELTIQNEAKNSPDGAKNAGMVRNQKK